MAAVPISRKGKLRPGEVKLLAPSLSWEWAEPGLRPGTVAAKAAV